jgi:hypothetical protein
MQALLRILALLSLAVFLTGSSVNATAAPKAPTIAVILLGSPEYRTTDYYQIVREALLPRFPAERFALVIGDHPQQMFDRFSDKQGLLPGATPADEKLLEFAWSHSFDEVIFFQVAAPHIRGKDISVQWEQVEVTINARALRIQSRARKIAAEASVTKTVKLYHRNLAKQSAFRQCVEYLRDQL